MMKKYNIYKQNSIAFISNDNGFSCRSNDDITGGGDKQATLKINMQE